MIKIVDLQNVRARIRGENGAVAYLRDMALIGAQGEYSIRQKDLYHIFI